MYRLAWCLFVVVVAVSALEKGALDGIWQVKDVKIYRADNGRLSSKKKWSPKSYQYYWELGDNTLTTYTHKSWAYPFKDQIDTVAYGCFMKLRNTMAVSDSTVVVGVRDTLQVLYAAEDSLVVKCPSFTKGHLDRYYHRELKRVDAVDSLNCRGE